MLRVALGRLGFALGPQGYLDTNMSVSATRKFPVGDLAQRKGLRVAVEYRLKDKHGVVYKSPWLMGVNKTRKHLGAHLVKQTHFGLHFYPHPLSLGRNVGCSKYILLYFSFRYRSSFLL